MVLKRNGFPPSRECLLRKKSRDNSFPCAKLHAFCISTFGLASRLHMLGSSLSVFSLFCNFYLLFCSLNYASIWVFSGYCKLWVFLIEKGLTDKFGSLKGHHSRWTSFLLTSSNYFFWSPLFLEELISRSSLIIILF